MSKDYRFNLKEKKIWVAGHNGMVGKAIFKKLSDKKLNILTADKDILNLTDQYKTFDWIKKNSPQVIFLAAAQVGGIKANSLNQADFLYKNLMIQNNVIRAAVEFKVEKLIFLGSSCIYPKEAPQPIKEDALLSSPLEQTNEGYAIAKIAGLKLCSYLFKEHKKDFITVMPTNLYGPNDNFDLETSHVLAALINKITFAKKHNKKSIEIWGTGKPKRDFLHVYDLADALIFLAENYSSLKPINVGSSKEISIAELARVIAKIVDWHGNFNFNTNMPDGTMLKRLDTNIINSMGWFPKIDIRSGIRETIKEYLSVYDI